MVTITKEAMCAAFALPKKSVTEAQLQEVLA